MTVCIAAICGFGADKGPFVITAADRMITMGHLEFEPAQTKSVEMASHTLALFSGNMELHAVVAPKVRNRVNLLLEENGSVTVAEIADFYAEEFGFYRRQMAEREILVPRGLSFDRFLNRTNNHNMPHYQLSNIDSELLQYYIDSMAIIVGMDRSGAHIYKIRNPGVATCCDTECFACIGSGEPIASTQFMVSKFDKGWSFTDALWLTFVSKVRAQASGGVGDETDIAVITPENKIRKLDKENLNFLFGLFADNSAAETASTAKARSSISAYIQSLADTEQKEDAPHAAGVDQTAAEKATATPPQKEKQKRPRKLMPKE